MLPGTAEAGEALVRHPLVQKISFTGGPTAARAILADCAESLKPAVLELGGKSASLVFPDADLDAVAFIATASVHQTLAGQGCALATRLVVHDSVYDELAAKVVAFTGGHHPRRPVRPRHRHGSGRQPGRPGAHPRP